LLNEEPKHGELDKLLNVRTPSFQRSVLRGILFINRRKQYLKEHTFIYALLGKVKRHIKKTRKNKTKTKQNKRIN